MKKMLSYLFSRGLYSFAFASVPVLLSISAAQDGYNSSEIGLILGLGALPAVFGGVLAPIFLYRVSQKKLFSIITIVLIIVSVACALYSQNQKIPLQGYVSISFFLELAGAIMIPTMGSFLPQIVDHHDLARINSIQSFILGICSAVGPAFVSTNILLFDVSLTWGIIAGFMFLSLLLQTFLPEGSPIKPDNIFSGILSDFKYLIKQAPLLNVIVGSGVWHFIIWSLFMTHGPIIMKDHYDSPWAWGFIQSIFSAGSIIGSLITIPDRFKTAPVCLLSLVPFCFIPLEMLLEMPLWMVYLSVAIGSLTIAAASVRWSTALQRSVPSNHLAGIFAFDYVLSEGISPIGFILIPMACSSSNSAANYFAVGLTVLILVILSIGNKTLLSYERKTDENK